MVRVLAIDPGAVRLGWSVVNQPQDGPLEVVDSGILGLERGRNGAKNEEFQVYKLRLIDYFVQKVPVLLRKYLPTTLVNEIQPAVGGGNFIAATQSELAKTALTVFQTFALAGAIRVEQLGSTTIKKRVANDGRATKAKIRNAVVEYFPDLGEELKRETTGPKPVWDRSDALATALAYLSVNVKEDVV